MANLALGPSQLDLPMLEIKRVESRRDLKAFVRLPFALYEGCSWWVPPLLRELMETLDPAQNPAFEQAEAKLFLAVRDGRPVGRVAAIHSRQANLHHDQRNLRFGWFETIADYGVAQALLAAVEDWAWELGLETISGPQGFCDLDPQGMLIEGFEELPTIATYYNYPYYPQYLERYGFAKEVDYVELQLRVEDQTGLPPRLARLADAVERRCKVRVLELKHRREARYWAPQVLEVLNESFAELYGVVPLTQRQVSYYIDKLFPFLDKEFMVALVDQEDALAGFAVAMPSLSRAMQKARGRLLPLGWWHLLRGLKNRHTLDYCLVGVRKRYQRLGLPALIMARLYGKTMGNHFYRAESNPILEDNHLSLALYEPFHPRLHKRRRIYKKIVSQPHAAGQASHVRA